MERKISYISYILLCLVFASCNNSQFLAGNGDGVEQFSSIFIQSAESRKIDLLIVVDNSISMKKDQKKLSTQFSNFISRVEEADYRIGVITTDTDSEGFEEEPGYFGNLDTVAETGKNYISKEDENPPALFAQLINRKETVECGTPCASPRERPLTAIRMAIAKRHTVNQGFFRKDAELGVLIITDEDETSFEDTGEFYSAKDLVENFITEFGTEKKLIGFSIAILEGDTECFHSQENELSADSNATFYGIRIGELAYLTDGFNLNICNENYSEGLKLISNYLSRILTPLKIKVPESILLYTIELKIITPDGKPFESDYIVRKGYLEISPLPPEGSEISLKYEWDTTITESP